MYSRHPVTMIARPRPTRIFLAALTCAVVACSIALSSVPSSAQTPSAPITLGGEPVSATQVESAVLQCQKHAAEMTVAECLDRYWVPRWLLDAEAREQKLAGAEHLIETRREILSTRLLQLLAEQTKAPTPSEIDSYLKKQERDFVKPLRVRIFRILLKTEEKAREILAKLDATTSILAFRKLARDHSIDKATNERGGDLGFIWPDGSTDVPEVSADPALYTAALGLADGEFSQVPVAEGSYFAVLWRRGSLPAQEKDNSHRSLAHARLLEEKAAARATSLLAELGKEVVGRNDELLGKLRRPEASLFRAP